MTNQAFPQRVVIITGASSGIGRALSLGLAAQGAYLALASRDARRLAEVAAACHERGGRAIVVPTDVADEEQCRQLIERACAEYRRIDMLINNAGIAQGARLDELPDLKTFERVIHVNFMGAVYCTFYALPHLKATCGRIVNISSLGGKFPLPYNTSYIASKHALEGFSEALRLELTGSGVSVTVICPYWVVTEFHERFMDKTGQPVGVRGRRVYTGRTPTAERIAPLILKAAARRRRDLVMWPGGPASWLKLIAPGLLDRLIISLVMRPAIRRAA